jgi:CheY-like chemotaxis protein
MVAKLEVTDNKVIKVLHVDDEEDQLLFTKFFLEQLDSKFIVDSLTNPEEVLNFQLYNYDIIVSDYKMLNMNGIELFRIVRKISDIPFILYTGKSSEEVEDSANKAGIDGYLMKKIDPAHYQSLCDLIKLVIEKSKRRKITSFNIANKIRVHLRTDHKILQPILEKLCSSRNFD